MCGMHVCLIWEEYRDSFRSGCDVGDWNGCVDEVAVPVFEEVGGGTCVCNYGCG